MRAYGNGRDRSREQACIRGGQPGTALEVFDQLTKVGGVEEDEVISTLLVQAHAMVGHFDEAFQAITVSNRISEGAGDSASLLFFC